MVCNEGLQEEGGKERHFILSTQLVTTLFPTNSGTVNSSLPELLGHSGNQAIKDVEIVP